MMLSAAEEIRFWAKVQKTDGCWLWSASRQRRGYGTLVLQGKGRLAHRVAYELLRGPVPDGCELDHTCRNTACVNPDHVEPVSHRINVLRGTSPAARNAAMTVCKRGHALTPENTLIYDGGRRRCRTCTRERNRASERRARERRSA